MILEIFSVYDSKAEAYMTPFFMQSVGQALRSFIDASEDTNTQLSRHPEDFTLFHIGKWDDDTCTINMLKTPVSLGLLIALLPAKTV